MGCTLETPIATLLNNEITDEMMKDMWYDWFCKDTSLLSKGKSLIAKLRKIVKVNNNKFNPETTYVFFKNSCPCNGSLYDDFRICDIETGNVLFCVTPKSGHKSILGIAELDGKINQFKEPLAKGTFNDILNWFKS